MIHIVVGAEPGDKCDACGNRNMDGVVSTVGCGTLCVACATQRGFIKNRVSNKERANETDTESLREGEEDCG